MNVILEAIVLCEMFICYMFNLSNNDPSIVYSNGSDADVIWLNVGKGNIKVEILNKLNKVEKVLKLLPNQGTRVPAKGSVRKIF